MDSNVRLGPYWVPPPTIIDPAKSYAARVELEDGRTFVIELFTNEAPHTVNNFVFLAKEGYYDGERFPGVEPGVKAQIEDPGGADYYFDNEFHPDLRHDGPGIVSMANSGFTGGIVASRTTFFITLGAVPSFDGLSPDGSPKQCDLDGVSCHTVFGKVIDGMHWIETLNPGNPIQRITIEES